MDSANNPYQPPGNLKELSPPAGSVHLPDHNGGPDAEKIAAYAQMILRVFGVVMLVEGLGLLAFGVVYGVVAGRELAGTDYGFYGGFFNATTLAYAGWAAVQFAGAFYLMLGGRWLIETVFLPNRWLKD